MINHLKAQLQEIKKSPDTSAYRGFFGDVNRAFKNGEISEEERAELWREIKA